MEADKIRVNLRERKKEDFTQMNFLCKRYFIKQILENFIDVNFKISPKVRFLPYL